MGQDVLRAFWRGKEHGMRTLAVINQKGGCGKTTTSINLAAVFASRGYRTLLVDLDPQGHCAAGLAVPEGKIDKDIGDAMLAVADKPVAASKLLWRVARNLDLVPSRTRLAGLEAAKGGLAQAPDREKRLLMVIEQLTGTAGLEYDVCLIDCPPSIGLLTYNALTAAREILIPVETSFFSLQGAAKQLSTVRSVGRRIGMRHRPRLIPTIHDPASALARDLLEELRRTRARAVILDLSGVEILDTSDYRSIHRTLRMSRLMGAEPIIVGLRAGIAASLAELGAELDEVRAFG
ncbi:MAG: AAA family ATPase, partial [Planctomycetota bacterium]